MTLNSCQYPGGVWTPEGTYKNYDELVIAIPALFGDTKGNYLVQLYLGSLESESAVQPIMHGLMQGGFPKRTSDWGTYDCDGGQAVGLPLRPTHHRGRVRGQRTSPG